MSDQIAQTSEASCVEVGAAKAAEPKTQTESWDNDAAIDFLRNWDKDSPWAIVAIDPKIGDLTGRHFAANEEAQLRAFLDDCGRGEKNVYFHVNRFSRSTHRVRAKREDISHLTHLHVDIDPRAGEDLRCEQERILRLIANPPVTIPAPTWITYSGGGYQVFWKLEEPLPLDGGLDQADDAKLFNLYLERVFQADNCHNIDRIMRLPGTINVPNAKKREKGRTKKLAKIIEHQEDRIYPLSAFSPADSTQPGADRKDTPSVQINEEIKRAESIEDLMQWAEENGGDLPESLQLLIVKGDAPDATKYRGDRSAALFAAVCGMARASLTDSQIYSVITDPSFGISSSVLDKDTSIDRYARRQIARAREQADDFRCDGKGRPKADDQQNIRLAISKMGVHLRWNSFASVLEVAGLDNHGPLLDDVAVGRIFLQIDERFGFLPRRELFHTVVQDVAHQNTYHPVLDKLSTFDWDGTERISRWLVDYADAPDTPFVREVGRIMLVAAVRRLRHPGCKFDELPVLEGTQGCNKSSALRVLAISDDWFSDALPLTADAKRVIESLSGVWIAEVAELNGLRRADVENVKSLLSRSVDRARMAYARIPTSVPRQCIFIGTTNSDRYLTDPTGNRRFWPVPIAKFDLEKLQNDVEQLWAEAAVREARGKKESIRLDPSLYLDAAREQAERVEEEPFAQVLDGLIGDRKGLLSIEDAWQLLDIEPRHRTALFQKRLGTAARQLGWKRERKSVEGKRSYYYVIGTSDQMVFSERLGKGVDDGHF